MGISIRYRKLKNGNYSVYFDIFQNGKRICENTGMEVSQDYYKIAKEVQQKYKRGTNGKLLFPKIKPDDKETIEEVKKMFRQKECDLDNRKIDFSKLQRISFTDFLRKVAATKKSPACYTKIIPTINKYLGENFPLIDFDETKLRGYLNYLANCGTLKSNSIQSYFFGLNAALNQAVREKLIPVNPKCYLGRHELPSSFESKREHLTIEELRKLNDFSFETHHNKQIPDAFFFACLTGLRSSDLTKIRHSDIKGGVLEYRQKKSNKQFHYLPLNEQALAIIDRQEKSPFEDTIFWKLPYKVQNVARFLSKWVRDAGIDKHVTWHVGRHTHASLLINQGVDIFVVSKLLGHSSVTITQRYTKISDKTKIEAIMKLPTIKNVAVQIEEPIVEVDQFQNVG